MQIYCIYSLKGQCPPPQSTFASLVSSRRRKNAVKLFLPGGGALIVISDVDTKKLCILAWV